MQTFKTVRLIKELEKKSILKATTDFYLAKEKLKDYVRGFVIALLSHFLTFNFTFFSR